MRNLLITSVLVALLPGCALIHASFNTVVQLVGVQNNEPTTQGLIDISGTYDAIGKYSSLIVNLKAIPLLMTEEQKEALSEFNGVKVTVKGSFTLVDQWLPGIKVDQITPVKH